MNEPEKRWDLLPTPEKEVEAKNKGWLILKIGEEVRFRHRIWKVVECIENRLVLEFIRKDIMKSMSELS